ncbi:Uncharacterized protein TCM_029363 [Theobroma cacao]|uniref:Helitron helicase-like domain-containing protein n=1 Tax=Theobroma cacao TaxID=3641 RepID=A0A061GCA7_THECC|nr:Uncharacterized protein TCM_029363 [Theobroma cacao]
MPIFAHQNTSNIINKFIVEGLIKMFDETNEIFKVFRQARDRCEESDNISIQLKLLETRNNRDKNYATPIGSERAGLIVGDVGESDITYTIEFQKRGPPHVHILLWLESTAKCMNDEDVDRIISAEIPNKEHDPVGHEAISNFMIHGQCGMHNPSSPCMTRGNGNIPAFNYEDDDEPCGIEIPDDLLLPSVEDMIEAIVSAVDDKL